MARKTLPATKKPRRTLPDATSNTGRDLALECIAACERVERILSGINRDHRILFHQDILSRCLRRLATAPELIDDFAVTFAVVMEGPRLEQAAEQVAQQIIEAARRGSNPQHRDSSR